MPETAYVGVFRGDRGLEGVRVAIGDAEGAAPEDVQKELAAFNVHIGLAIEYLDELILPGDIPSGEQLAAVLDLMAWCHAQWVRIHPFANGNGRSARIWANAIAMRYGLPPFVALRPRPEGGAYTRVAAAAMNDEWGPTAVLFADMLHDFLSAD